MKQERFTEQAQEALAPGDDERGGAATGGEDRAHKEVRADPGQARTESEARDLPEGQQRDDLV